MYVNALVYYNRILGGYREDAIILIMSICPICKTKLIPVVYGKVNPDIIELQNQGKLLIGMGTSSLYNVNSFCPLCEEAYLDFTDPPQF